MLRRIGSPLRRQQLRLPQQNQVETEREGEREREREREKETKICASPSVLGPREAPRSFWAGELPVASDESKGKARTNSI